MTQVSFEASFQKKIDEEIMIEPQDYMPDEYRKH